MRIIKRLLIVLGIILAVGYILGFSGNNPYVSPKRNINADDFISSCIQGDYEKVARNPDANRGRKMYISGTVIQVIENGKNVELRVQEKTGNIWYVLYAYENGESHILDGDQITVYGLCYGTITYQTVFGQQLTIPGIEGYFIR